MSTPIMWINSDNVLKNIRTDSNWILLMTTNNNPSSTGALVCGQTKITTTWTQVNLPANNVGQFVVVKAFSSNVWNITVWVTGVTNTVNGSGNGFILEPGDMLPIVVDNSNKIFINWTANDIVSYSLT